MDNYYLHFDGREYKISKKANDVINAISKDCDIKLEVDQEEEDGSTTDIWIHVYIFGKEKYRLGLRDIMFLGKLYFNSCHNYVLEEKYSNKFKNNEDISVTTHMGDGYFIVEIMKLEEGDDEEGDTGIYNIQIQDNFPKYLRKFKEIDYPKKFLKEN